MKGGPELPWMIRVKNESENIVTISVLPVNRNDDSERLSRLFFLWWNNITTTKIRNEIN